MSTDISIVTLQARLEETKRQKIELKKQLREKQSKLRAQAKVAKRAAQEGQPSFLQKCERLVDTLTLTLCKPFETRAIQLRHKQEDPDGYEADCAVEDVSRLVQYFQKKAKKRELKDTEFDVLVRLDTTLDMVSGKKLGTKVEEVYSLKDDISDLLPLELKEQMAAIDSIIPRDATPEQMQELLDNSFEKVADAFQALGIPMNGEEKCSPQA